MRSNRFYKHSEAGQVLVIMLLVAVVGLTVGLSIAGRSLQNIKQTGEIEETSRAYSAAEAGVEEALLQLQQGTPIPTVPASSLTGGGQIVNVTSQNIQPDASNPYIVELAKDDVVQLDLDDGTGASTVYATDTSVQWECLATDGSQDPALVMTQIYRGTDGSYKVKKYAFDSIDVRRSLNGFAEVGSVGTDYSFSRDTSNSTCTVTITYQDPPDSPQPLVLRIRAMYYDTKLEITGTDLPVQGTEVTSVGQSGEAERAVKVVRSKPALPAIFDFTLFSGGDIIK